MQLFTTLQIPKHKIGPISYNSKIMLLGSCFSENIGKKMVYYQFNQRTNPLGILFHPLAIETFVINTINLKHYTEADIFFHNKQWHCFDAHSKWSNVSKQALLEQLNLQIQMSNSFLKTATHIIITLGTGWVYRFKTKNSIVANCHKLPQQEFVKELLTIETIKSALGNMVTCIRQNNPSTTIIFTVSPVRHLKEGFIKNMQSKAHLISAIHQYIKNQDKTLSPALHYFPAYEIMMDELRDYRFYNPDMIHPNTVAVDCIWEKFKSAWINCPSQNLMKKVDGIQKRLLHKAFRPSSDAYQLFLKQLQEDIASLKHQFPYMSFSQ